LDKGETDHAKRKAKSSRYNIGDGSRRIGRLRSKRQHQGVKRPFMSGKFWLSTGKCERQLLAEPFPAV
jgi:hypothetical protein